MITLSQKQFALCVLSVFLSFSVLAQEGEHMTALVTGQSRDTKAKQMYELASQYRALTKLGQFDQAIPIAKQSLSLFDELLGAEHPDKAGGMFDLAWMYFQTRDYAKAEPLLSQVVAIKKQVLGENNPSYVSYLEMLAALHVFMEDHGLAITEFQQVADIRKKNMGKDSPEYAKSLHAMAGLHASIGDYRESESLYAQAIEIRRKALGDKHIDYAESLSGLARLYLTEANRNEANGFSASQGAATYGKAEVLLRQALQIRKESLGEKHLDYASSLIALADFYRQSKDYPQAEALYKQGLEIYESNPAGQNLAYATALNNLGYLYVLWGKFSEAELLFHQSLSIDEQRAGPDSQRSAMTLFNLASVLGVLGKNQESLNLCQRGNAIVGRLIEKFIAAGTEKQSLTIINSNNIGYYGTLSLIHHRLANDANAVSVALNLVLSRKGIVFDAQARQQDAIARSLDPETKKLWDALSNQRAELAKLMQSKPEKMAAEDYQKRIADYQSAIAQREGPLAAKSSLVAQDLQQRKVTHKEVARILGKEGVLVEHAKIHDYDWDHGQWADTWRYLAFILHGDGKIQMVDLGDAAELEANIQPALRAVGLVGGDGDLQQQATRTLHKQLWQPIAAAVGDANQIVFSPDGLLNLVPFAAMQDADGHYLIESRQISYVTSGRDLTKGDLGIKPETELYLAANPKFDLVVQVSPTPASEELTRGAVRSAGFGMSFSPLPGTAQEAERIPGYLNGKHTVLTGKEATEDSVLSVRRPRVMHLSTHGFFLGDQVTISQGTRGAARIDGGKSQPNGDNAAPALPPGYENPLVRSGLAFAGANHAGDAKGGRDGLLTALEVSGMDLHGTDLVTLSACETGRGEVKSGEGVFGLRRAFALAGTAHLMMSLWPVSDDVTAQQMQRFYQLYGKKTNPAAALRQAQLATIAELRSKKGQAEPALWAPFIVQGKRSSEH